VRIHVVGESTAAETLRGYLTSLGYKLAAPGYKLSAGRAACTIRIEAGAQGKVVIEGVPGELSEQARRAVAELTATQVEWREAAIAGSELRVAVHGSDTDAVERGLLRALLRVTGHGQPKTLGRKLRDLLHR
jgi:hypothetical protein